MDDQCCVPEDPPDCPPPPEEACCEDVVEDVCEDDASSRSTRSRKDRKRRGRGRRRSEDVEGDDRSDRSSQRSKERRRRRSRDRQEEGGDYGDQPYAQRQFGSGGWDGGGQPPPYYPPPMAPMDPMRASLETEQVIRKSKQEAAKGLIQCDIIALLILIAWTFALVVVILASFYYQADSDWNKIVHVEKPLGQLENETYFSGKYFYLYRNVPKLSHAKVHALREDRALEVVHITFFSLFLAFTLVQFVMYVTRGKADHTKILIIYYGLFGGLGLIIAIFPHISWTMLDVNYRANSMKLQEFVRNQFRTPQSQWSSGVTNATAYDAIIASQISDFCAGQSQYSIFSVDRRYIDFFGRDYNIHDFHALGFCSHHKCRSTNSLMGYIFAIICCVIPCASCVIGFNSKVTDTSITQVQRQKMSWPPPGQGGQQQQPFRQSLPAPIYASNTQYFDDDGNPLTGQQIKVIEKFKRYVLTDKD